jgi:sporulation protein YlmC with PRC-barrel domain
MTPRVLSSSTLTGTTVKNLGDEKIGEIRDLMIDVQSGNVAYAVLSFGGFLGLGDKLFAIPLEAFNFNQHHVDAHVVLDINKEKLENAPGFDKDDWPEHPQTEFMEQIYSHYGYEPYWTKANRPL